MDIIELSDIQQLLFSLEEDTVEEIYSIIIRSDYFQTTEKYNLLLANISLLIELRPKLIDKIIALCHLLNKMQPTNSFSIQLFTCLLSKLTQEHQYFIYKAFYSDLFNFFLIKSSVEHLINSSQEKKAYSIVRWFSNEFNQMCRSLFNQVASFDFLKSVEIDKFKANKNTTFLLQKSSSKFPTELMLFDILRRDDIGSLQLSMKPLSELMMKKKHFFAIDSLYSQLTESSVLIDDNLSVFDICAYYNSINCFEFLCKHVESGNKTNFLQSLNQERVKSFNVLHYAIAGGSIQIILSLIDHKFPIDDCIQCAIYFHRNDLLEYFSEIDTEIPKNPMLLINSSKDIWGTPLFQACHTNNIEVFLQMINYKSLQTSLKLPYQVQTTTTSTIPNPFFYNINLYIYLYDNIIKSRNELEVADDKSKSKTLFKFKNYDEADSYLSYLLSSVRFSKETLINALFYLCKKGYSELLKLMIKELYRTSKLTEKMLSEKTVSNDVLQFLFDLNVTDQNGNTMLILASKFNQISCVKVLINIEQVLNELNEIDGNDDEYNFGEINIDAFNNERRSALEYACFNGNHEIVDLLLSTGRIGIENLHKSLILCLRSYSYYSTQTQSELNDIKMYDYPYSYTYRDDSSKCNGNGRKFNTKSESFEKILKAIINAFKQASEMGLLESSSSDVFSSNEDISASEKIRCPFYFSMYLKTIEKYSIENDNVEIFAALMNSPETPKSLTKARCAEIINNAIKNNSINILKYIFSNFENKEKHKASFSRCPIIVDKDENFLSTAISSNAYDASEYLFKLGIFDLSYNDIFKALEYPEIIRLIYENKPEIILRNINELGTNQQTLLIQSAISKYVETFRFLMNLPVTDINIEGKKFDAINEAYLNGCDRIFVMCCRHPTINMKKKSFVENAAMQRIIEIGDVFSAKAILEKYPNLDLTEQYIKINSYMDDYYGRNSSEYSYKKKSQCLIEYAISNNQKDIVNYFNHYLAINNKKPYVPNSRQKEPETPSLRELDLNIEKAIIEDDFESLKKLINKDTINMHFERNGVTPLNTAILIENVEMVKYLLSVPEVDVNLENEVRGYKEFQNYPDKQCKYNIDQVQSAAKSYGDTPLMIAIKSKKKELFQLIMAMPSIDINKESNEKITPLVQAIRTKGKFNTFYSIHKSAKKFTGILNSKTPNPEKEKENEEVQFMINTLIKSDGIDINKGTKGYPLEEAIKSDQLETIKLMIELFTDLPSDSKKTPLNLTRKPTSTYQKSLFGLAKSEEIKKILREKGVEEDITSKAYSRTPPTSEPVNNIHNFQFQINNTNNSPKTFSFTKNKEKPNNNNNTQLPTPPPKTQNNTNVGFSYSTEKNNPVSEPNKKTSLFAGISINPFSKQNQSQNQNQSQDSKQNETTENQKTSQCNGLRFNSSNEEQFKNPFMGNTGFGNQKSKKTYDFVHKSDELSKSVYGNNSNEKNQPKKDQWTSSTNVQKQNGWGNSQQKESFKFNWGLGQQKDKSGWGNLAQNKDKPQ